MARVIGRSQAFEAIRSELGSVGLRISSVAELAPMAAALREAMSGAPQRAIALHRQYSIMLEKFELEHLPKWQSYRDALAAYYEHREECTRLRLEGARDALEALGPLWRCLHNPSRVSRWMAARAAFRATVKQFDMLNQERKSALQAAELAIAQIRSHRANHNANAEAFCAKLVSDLARQFRIVTQQIESGAAGGAAAELEVIEILRKLPDEWVVLNDVRLITQNWRRYRQSHIKSAQLDHVAVGPPGVFVIETKNWSSDFVATGDYHDPFDQVSRAAYLCHHVLKAQGLPNKTRGIVCTRTRLGALPNDTYAKLLRPEGICGYMTYFQPALNASEVEDVAAFLSRLVGSRE